MASQWWQIYCPTKQTLGIIYWFCTLMNGNVVKRIMVLNVAFYNPIIINWVLIYVTKHTVLKLHLKDKDRFQIVLF